MCTAITYKTQVQYFGRNLDLECSYGEAVTITPRQFPFFFRKTAPLTRHYAIIGMAHIAEGYPLYYDAVNEAGVAMAGLNFPDNACYYPEATEQDNIAPFEFIPWVLSQCASLAQVRRLLHRTNLTAIPFSADLPLTPLHWMIADTIGSITVEPMENGLRIYDNPVGVLTNNPPFDFQLMQLRSFLTLSREPAENTFAHGLDLQPYSRGMGAMGLPGDLSSASRFVRAAFTRLNSVSGTGEKESISQFFHILDSVAQPRGCVHLGRGAYECTLYTSCCNLDRGTYYYTTYENRQITAVDLHCGDPEASSLTTYPLRATQSVFREN